MSTFINNIKFTSRQLLKNPVFALVAVLTLALGIGANTAIFSVVYSVLLKPLPYPDSTRLVRLMERTPTMSAISISYPNFLDWREQQRVFEDMGVYNFGNYNLTGQGAPIRLEGARMSAAIFSTLGINAAIGRVYAESDDQPDAPAVVLLGHAFWRDRFSSDATIINQVITLNGKPHEVIGVMPGDFEFPKRVDIWLPVETLRSESGFMNRSNHPGLRGVARLKAGVTIEQASAELQAISARLANQYPDENKNISARVDTLFDSVVGDDRDAFWILLGAVTLLLIIACVNVANLLLARATVRQKEFAIRSAIGASRGRIIGQLLSESVLLSLLGGLVGVSFAFMSVEAIRTLGQTILPRASEIHVDLTVLAFASLVTLSTGVVFGLMPARQATGAEIEKALKDSTRSSTRSRAGIRQWLVSGQVALTLVLLVGAGLLLRTFHQLVIVDPGFRDKHLLSFEMNLPQEKYETESQRIGFYQPLLERLRELPGVKTAGIASQIPLQRKGWQTPFQIEGRPEPADGTAPIMEVSLASPGFFETMQISVLRGRTFNDQDNRSHLQGREVPPDQSWRAGLKAIVIDDGFARRYWPDDDPIGKRIRLVWGDPAPVLTVVGVVGRVKFDRLTETGGIPQGYFPFLQAPNHAMTVVLKTTIPPEQIVAAARKAVLYLDPAQPIFNVRTVSELRNASISRQRLNLTLMIAFAAVALVLAAVGLYGVLAFNVAQQKRELGIRMALGAQKADVLWQVLRHGLRLVVIGCAVGFVTAIGLAHMMRAMLFRVGPVDPLTFSSVSLLLLLVAIFACWVPARRATRVDPMEALRYE